MSEHSDEDIDDAVQMPAHYPAAVEALLFAAEGPLSDEDLQIALSEADELLVPREWVHTCLAQVEHRYQDSESGLQMIAVAGGWDLRTRAAYGAYVRQLYQASPIKLSRAALEVMAVVAYRQPCTRADIEEIRGVDCSGLIRRLLERSLLRIIGKADEVGRPLLYGTSDTFLEFFGLSALSELPTLSEYAELSEDHVVKLQELEETLEVNQRADDTEATKSNE